MSNISNFQLKQDKMFNPLFDKPGTVIGIIEFLAGVIFFPLVCLSAQVFFRTSKAGKFYCQQFKISSNGIHDISNKITSSTFAILACSVGLFVNRQCSGDIMKERFYILDNYLIFGVSYFFYDCVSMYLVYSTLNKDGVTFSQKEVYQFLSSRPLIVFHHVLVPLVGFPALMYFRNGVGDCLLGTSFMIEASTPFVSARVILVHLKMKDRLVYVINGLLMLMTFFFCRVMLFPMLYLWYSTALSLSLSATLTSIPLWCHLATLGLWFPQLIWFSKMVKGSIKILKDRRNCLKVETRLIDLPSHRRQSGDSGRSRSRCPTDVGSSDDTDIARDDAVASVLENAPVLVKTKCD